MFTQDMVGASQPENSITVCDAASATNGGSCTGEPGPRAKAPGPRANAPGNAYGADLRDPDGDKICAFGRLPG